MTLINTYGSAAAAHIQAGMLESYGIHCQITEGALASVYPLPDAALEGINLYVEDSQAKRALELLKEHGDII